jgi:hypothetical protein
VSLPIVEDLLSWLKARMSQVGGSVEALEKAMLTLNYANRVPTDRKRIVLFDLECIAQLGIGERVFEGHADNAVWYQRSSYKRL